MPVTGVFGLAENGASILNPGVRFIACVAAIALASGALAQISPAPKRPVDQLIPWLLDEEQELRGVSFSEVIFDTTGKKCCRSMRTTQSIGASQKPSVPRAMKL